MATSADVQKKKKRLYLKPERDKEGDIIRPHPIPHTPKPLNTLFPEDCPSLIKAYLRTRKF